MHVVFEIFRTEGRLTPKGNGLLRFDLIRSTRIFSSFAALSYRWLLNEFPNFIKKDDGRWFVSQVTGNLYLAKAEPNDTGNYFCFTTINMDISTKSTFSKANQLTVLPEGTTLLRCISILKLP